MNKERRIKLKEITEKLESLLNDLEQVRDDEEDAFYNLPESLQDSTKGLEMMDILDTLGSIYADLEVSRDELQEVIEE